MQISSDFIFSNLQLKEKDAVTNIYFHAKNELMKFNFNAHSQVVDSFKQLKAL